MKIELVIPAPQPGSRVVVAVMVTSAPLAKACPLGVIDAPVEPGSHIELVREAS